MVYFFVESVAVQACGYEFTYTRAAAAVKYGDLTSSIVCIVMARVEPSTPPPRICQVSMCRSDSAWSIAEEHLPSLPGNLGKNTQTYRTSHASNAQALRKVGARKRAPHM